MDLIAVPWVENPESKDELAARIHQAACGIQRQAYQWEAKPRGRTATSFPICWTDWNETNLGHIDLSVMGELGDEIESLRAKYDALVDLENKIPSA
jgi:hypothetical protein